MSRKLLYALLLLAVAVIVLLLTRDRVSINLAVATLRCNASLAMLTFLAVGVVVGLLLK